MAVFASKFPLGEFLVIEGFGVIGGIEVILVAPAGLFTRATFRAGFRSDRNVFAANGAD